MYAVKFMQTMKNAVEVITNTIEVNIAQLSSATLLRFTHASCVGPSDNFLAFFILIEHQ